MKRRNFIGLSTLALSLSKLHAADAGEKPVLSFGLITDVQYADADPEGERHYRESIPKLKTAVEWLAKKNLPFTLHLGDLIDRDFKSFSAVIPLLEGLGHPVRQLLGNHDYTLEDAEKCRVVSTVGMPRDYYQFRDSGVRFVMLDTNDLSTYKYPSDSPHDLESEALMKKLVEENQPNAKPWNGGLSETQLTWLEAELTAADMEKERVILCGHHPLLPSDSYRVWNSDAVLALIDRHSSVAAYFNGHCHAGAEEIRNGIPYITFKSMLHEPGVNSYSAIHLFADRLHVEGNGREQSRDIPLKRV
jgi:manganese-dependent ADP-ribose/CDP-alcohol diphosphatase